MTVLQFALAVTFAGLLLTAAGWCLWTALRYERPTSSAPLLPLACWWVGQLLGWALLVVLVGGILGAAARAAWVLVGG